MAIQFSNRASFARRIPGGQMRRHWLTLLVLVPAIAIGCRGSGTDESDAGSSAAGPLHHSGANMSIRTTDGTMKLGVANDTVYMGLTDSVLAAARADMERDTEETGNAFSAKIENFVKKSVSVALRSRLKYPLSDLDSTTYSDGAIRFFYRNRRKIKFEDVSQNNHKALQSFPPDDAQRFVNTVNEAIRTVRGITK